MSGTMELMNKGMNILLEGLGNVEAEKFISVIIREKFDYTKWQREHFDDMDSDTFLNEAVKYDEEHPFVMKTQE